MPNSLKCRLKKLANQGLLSENDLSRIYTDNDVIEELEKLKAEVLKAKPYYQYYIEKEDFISILDKHIAELKGEQ